MSTRSWNEKANRPTLLRRSMASMSSRVISRKTTLERGFDSAAPPSVVDMCISGSRQSRVSGGGLGANSARLRVKHEQRCLRLARHFVGDAAEYEPAHAAVPARRNGDQVSPH